MAANDCHRDLQQREEILEISLMERLGSAVGNDSILRLNSVFFVFYLYLRTGIMIIIHIFVVSILYMRGISWLSDLELLRGGYCNAKAS